MTTVRLICLANSRKLSGTCVAGKELKRGRWIRPVSDREHQEVSARERRYEDGSEPQLLDVVDVPLLRPFPGPHQAENWTLDPDVRWQRIALLPWEELARYADKPPKLWVNGPPSTDGLNDRVSVQDATDVEESLYLLHVPDLIIDVHSVDTPYGSKRTLKGEFRHAGVDYRLAVTDPPIEGEFRAKPPGKYSLGESYLTISLAEPLRGYCYKLIAAVIRRPSVR